jgi:F-type H+-transporting ATPase subunit 8
MPQLVPFYFVNEIIFSIIILTILIFILSKYILPTILKMLISRIWIKDFL